MIVSTVWKYQYSAKLKYLFWQPNPASKEEKGPLERAALVVHPRKEQLRHDDFDAAVLRLADAVRGRYPGMLLAEPLHVEDILRHALLFEIGRDRVGAALRQAQIIGLRAGEIGIARDVDPGRTGGLVALCRGFDDPARIGRQVVFVEV